jgi:archaellum biogenesis ATPase FlaH
MLDKRIVIEGGIWFQNDVTQFTINHFVEELEKLGATVWDEEHLTYYSFSIINLKDFTNVKRLMMEMKEVLEWVEVNMTECITIDSFDMDDLDD